MGGVGSGRKKKATVAAAKPTVAIITVGAPTKKASGRMPAWATTKPKKAYVVAMRMAGQPYSNAGYTPYRKALKAGAAAPVAAKLPAKKPLIFDLVIADDSISMRGMRHRAALEGINAHVEILKSDAKKTGLKTSSSIMKFATRNSVVRDFSVASKMKGITKSDYDASGGSTSLNDAIVDGINHMAKAVGSKKNVDATITIFTDGGENSSNRSLSVAAKAVQDAKKKGWTIAFMGEGRAARYAEQLNVDASNVLEYKDTATAMKMYSASRSKKSVNLSRGISSNVGFFSK